MPDTQSRTPPHTQSRDEWAEWVKDYYCHVEFYDWAKRRR